MSNPDATEPGLRSYIFGKGYRDLAATLRGSSARNLASAKAEITVAARLWLGGWPSKALAVLRGSAGISIMISSTVLFLALSVVHVTVLALFFLLVYLGFTVLWLAEKAYLGVKGFFAVCPICHEKTPLPHYLCPGCGSVHRRLSPSSYGILQRTCLCGHRLPTTSWLGRGKLAAQCPNPECGHLFGDQIVESRKHFVPIYGGPAAGKSAFLFATVRELIHTASRQGVEAYFLDAVAAQSFERAREGLDRGRAPDKTRDRVPKAFNLKLSKPGEDDRLLYLYDPAGEIFNTEDDLVAQQYQAYMSGIILLVDPFSLPELRRELREKPAEISAALAPSTLDVADVLSRFLLGLEQRFGLGKTQQLTTPVAVVLNKIDACNLEHRVGETALEREMKRAEPGASREIVRARLLRSQLQQWGGGDLVHQLEARCKHVAYFACSSLGRSPDGSGRPFASRGVLAPLLWMLGSKDPVLRLRA